MAPTQHAAVGGSAISRILRCPGSVALVATLPRGSTPAADRGTMLHYMAGRMIERGERAEDLVGEEHAGVALTAHDAQHALLPAVAAYRKFVGAAKNVKLEVKVRHMKYVWGTADILGHHKAVGIVGDFKFGDGKVEVAHNEQLKFYASAALVSKKIPASTPVVRTGIIQPGARRVLEEHEYSAKTLWEFAREVKEIAKVALKPDAPIVPGEKQCQWCPAKKAGICPKLKPVQGDLAGNLAGLLARV